MVCCIISSRAISSEKAARHRRLFAGPPGATYVAYVYVERRRCCSLSNLQNTLRFLEGGNDMRNRYPADLVDRAFDDWPARRERR